MMSPTISACKALVGYMKYSWLNNKLTKTPKQQNDARWNSMLTMMDSILESTKKLISILKSEMQDKLQNVRFTAIGILVSFLKPFQYATLALEKDATPTIQYAYLWQKKLLSCMNVLLIDVP